MPASTRSTKSRRRNCSGETLTATRIFCSPASCHCADVAHGLKKDPFPDVDDGAGLLEQRNENRRLHDALLRVLPAQQRFEALDLAALDVDLRLIVQQKLFAIEGPGEPRFQRQAS